MAIKNVATKENQKISESEREWYTSTKLVQKTINTSIIEEKKNRRHT